MERDRAATSSSLSAARTSATEARAGLTTFMVMAYIIFVNADILGGGFGARTRHHAAAVAAGTALVAGIMTIAMGVVGNYPLALAAGLGINAIVAFTLTAAGLTPAGRDGRDRPRGHRRHAPRRSSASARRS